MDFVPRLVLVIALCCLCNGALAAAMQGHPLPCGPGETTVTVPNSALYRYRATASGPYSQWVNNGSATATATYACESFGGSVAQANHTCAAGFTCVNYRAEYNSGTSCDAKYTRTQISNGSVSTVQPFPNDSLEFVAAAQMCLAAAPSCTASTPGVGDEWTTTSFPGTDGYCHKVSGCRMSVSSTVDVGGQKLYTVKHTSNACASGAVPDDDDLPDGENCVTSGTEEFCASPSPKNCGYLNDEFVCLGAVENDGCKVFGDGGRVCGTNAPVPPRPDNGTPGIPAAANNTIAVTNTSSSSTFNFFNSTTVNNSARPPGTGGDNPHDGVDDGNGAGGEGDGEEEESEGSASGGVACDVAPSCSGDEIACAVLFQAWRARCPLEVTDAQVAAKIGVNPTIPSEEHDLAESLDENIIVASAGSCPAPPVIDLGIYGSFTFDVITWFCEYAERLSPFVMLFAYLSAAFIALKRD